MKIRLSPLLLSCVFLAGCSPVSVVYTSPPSKGCTQLGVVSSKGAQEEQVMRKLERDVYELGGNVLFIVATDKTSPDPDAPGVEPGTEKYGIAFDCMPY